MNEVLAYGEVRQWWPTQSQCILQVRALTPRPQTGGIGYQWWLLEEGVPVGYGKTTVWPDGDPPHTLLDIEIRDFARGRGLNRTLTDAMTFMTALQVHSTGNWTKLGAKALKHLPLDASYVPGIYHDALDFVADWDSMEARYN